MISLFIMYALILVLVIFIYQVMMIKERNAHREEIKWMLEQYEEQNRKFLEHNKKQNELFTNAMISKNVHEYKVATSESKPSPKPTNFLKSKIEEANRRSMIEG